MYCEINKSSDPAPITLLREPGRVLKFESRATVASISPGLDSEFTSATDCRMPLGRTLQLASTLSDLEMGCDGPAEEITTNLTPELEPTAPSELFREQLL